MLLGRVFDPEIVEHRGMKELVELVEFQKWSHLFTLPSPKVYEDEVKSFYASLFVVDEDTLCLNVNWKEFILDEENLEKIHGVRTDGLGTVEGTTSSAFKKLIVKGEETLSGLKVYKKELKHSISLCSKW